MRRVNLLHMMSLSATAAGGLADAVSRLPRDGTDWLMSSRVASQRQAMVRTTPPRPGKPPYSGKKEAARAAKRLAARTEGSR